MLLLVVLPAKFEYLEVKASNTHLRVLSDAVMPHPSGASMSQFLVLSAHWSTADSGGGGGVASAHSQAQHGHLLSPYPVLWDGGENRKNEKAHG